MAFIAEIIITFISYEVIKKIPRMKLIVLGIKNRGKNDGLYNTGGSA